MCSKLPHNHPRPRGNQSLFVGPLALRKVVRAAWGASWRAPSLRDPATANLCPDGPSARCQPLSSPQVQPTYHAERPNAHHPDPRRPQDASARPNGQAGRPPRPSPVCPSLLPPSLPHHSPTHLHPCGHTRGSPPTPRTGASPRRLPPPAPTPASAPDVASAFRTAHEHLPLEQEEDDAFLSSLSSVMTMVLPAPGLA